MDTTIRGKYSTYHMIKPLKSGGMGEVWLARDEMDRRVAIKRPFVSAQADGLARFELEAKAATLDHPNIAAIYEAGIQEDGRPYLAMEYVDGKELKEMIDSGQELDLLDKLRMIEQVCAGLGYAHQKGFIHRDIKPGNVMVQANLDVKIIDFGIAKIVDLEHTSNLTQTSQVIGSLHYIAPERFKNEAMDGRADVFSTGVMLYLLLTGKLPFSGGEVTAAYQILNEAPTALGAHIQDYPPALDEIMDRALAKNPEERFATAEDFGDALHEVIEELIKTRSTRLTDDAERLFVEFRYEPALERLAEAIKLDPSNTQARKLGKMVRDHQARRKQAERVKEYIARAEGFLAVENYTDALAQLRDAQRVDAASQELKDRIALVESTKQRYDRSVAALSQAEAAKNRGDITAALRISEIAVSEDPNNTRLLALRAAIAKQLERETQQAQLATIFDTARSELPARNFPQVERLLAEAEAIDRSHPTLDQMRREMAQIREREERRHLLEEIHRHVNDFLRADNYEKASDLLSRAVDKLPDETMLHRLKMEVDTAAQKFDSIRFVDHALASAQEAFAGDPQKALTILHEARQHRPGDERLIACERSLRQRADVLRTRQRLNETLRGAREFLAARQFEKAIDLLEACQLEHGDQADVGELLTLARSEATSQQRRLLIDRATTEARALIGNERLDDAARLLEGALQSTAIRDYGDGVLSGLLEDVRARKSAAERRGEAVVQRATTHRERGELDAAIQLLGEYLATGIRNASAENLLASLQTERTRVQVTREAIAAVEQATRQGRFTVALESLQGVVRAYAETEELTRAAEQVRQARSAHAQQVVGQSIETSRAALLASDVTGALAALRTANEMVEFADAARQADWRRIGQVAKKAQSEPTGTIIADPLAELPELTPTRKPASRLVIGLGSLAACVVVGIFVTLSLHRDRGAEPPRHSESTEGTFTIQRATPGALASIDGGTPHLIDATGSLTVPVNAGPHTLEVTKDGFDNYDENFSVVAGQVFTDNIPAMTRQPPKNNSGTLLMRGNLPAFKVTVDGHPRGEFFKAQAPLTLEAGVPHTIQYSNENDSDLGPKHSITIAAGGTTPDPFKLKPPIITTTPSKPGSLNIETNPNATVSVGGKVGKADQSGRFTVFDLPPANYTVLISLVDYQPFSGSVTVASGPPTSFKSPVLTRNAPIPGSLSIHTTAGAQISLNNGQRSGTADSLGIFDLPNLKPGTTYALDISKYGYEPVHLDEVVIAASPKTPISAVLARKSPLPPPQPQPLPHVDTAATGPKPEDHTADYEAIQTAKTNFNMAWQSKDLGRIQAAWLNAGGQAKKLKGVFDVADNVTMTQTCTGQPGIVGDTATQHCEEKARYFKSQKPTTTPFTYTFVKKSDKWVLRDRTSLR